MSENSRSPLLRRHALERELTLRGAASVSDLCDVLDVSPATIRRDLAELEKQGLIKRGYGGATVRAISPAEESLSVREQKYVEAKTALARRAVELIRPGDSIFLNDGSTVLALAHELAVRNEEIFVATPSVRVPGVFADCEAATVCLLGGFVNASAQTTGGHFAEAMVDQINVDYAFLSCDGFNPQDGLCFMNAEDAALARRMIKKATKCVALVHSAKFSWRARFSAVPLANIDILVTEQLPEGVTSALAQAEVQVLEAHEPAGSVKHLEFS